MTMMMMMKLAVVLAAVATPLVVQAQQSNPCSSLQTENECNKNTECTFLFSSNDCVQTTGFKSVARQGETNVAPGDFCTVGGGKLNNAGNLLYNAIGGGKKGVSFGNKGTISGGNNNIIDVETITGATISGGNRNAIEGDPVFPSGSSSFSVITGGGDEFNRVGNNIFEAEAATISGGKINFLEGEYGVITGGQKNRKEGKGTVVTGGTFNGSFGKGINSVIIGGKSNGADGDYSIAFGKNANAVKKNSMVMNLVPVPENEGETLFTTEDGQFLVKAESFRFQIGNGKNKNNGGISSFKITDENINRLIEALG